MKTRRMLISGCMAMLVGAASFVVAARGDAGPGVVAADAIDESTTTTVVDSTVPFVVPTRAIRFPVLGEVQYSDSYGDCRDGCSRYHQGNDLLGRKMQPLLAAVDGTVTIIHSDTGKHGVGITIADADGWTYTYYHVNNDVPGDADLETPEASDAARARWHMPPAIVVGSTVTAGQIIGWMGNSGNAEQSVPHLHFEIRDPDGKPINPYPSLVSAEWKDRCREILAPTVRTAPVLSPPEVVEGTLYSFPTLSEQGSFTISSSGGVITDGDAAFVGTTAHGTPSCDGDGPELTARSLPGEGEDMAVDPAATTVTGEVGAPDPDVPATTVPAAAVPADTVPATTVPAPAVPAPTTVADSTTSTPVPSVEPTVVPTTVAGDPEPTH